MHIHSLKALCPPAPSAHAHAPLLLAAGDPEPTLAARLQRVGLAPGGAARWGSESAFAAILRHRPGMVLLDAPTVDTGTMTRLVKAASLIAPVAVMRPDGNDAVAAFDAGAYDVLDPQAPIVELAWRIRADLRHCSPAPVAAAYTRGTASQRLLFDVLARRRTAICCHHLRLLLGSPALPMTLRALRARIKRLLPTLSAHGLELVVDQQWGLATYSTFSGAQETSLLTSMPTA